MVEKIYQIRKFKENIKKNVNTFLQSIATSTLLITKTTTDNIVQMEVNAFQLLAGVPEFDGRAEELQMFTTHVDEIRKHVHTEQLTLFDLRVRNKIVARANVTLINNNNPLKWDEIKVILRINFNISDSVESIINKIKTAELRTSVSDFYEYLISLLTKLNLKTSIDRDNEQWFSCKNNEKMVLRIFISKLPNEPKLILHSRNPHSLLKAKEILVETEYFYYRKSNSQSFSPNCRNNQNENLFENQNTNFNNSQSFSQFRNSNYNTNQKNYFNSQNLHKQPNSYPNSAHHSRNYSGNFGRNNTNFDNKNSSGVFNNNNSTNSQQTNINKPVPMEVDNIQVSNFQLQADELYPA